MEAAKGVDNYHTLFVRLSQSEHFLIAAKGSKLSATLLSRVDETWLIAVLL